MATTCVTEVAYDGREYSPWCIGVQPRLLLEEPLVRGTDVNTDYEARLIEGVLPELAIAVATSYPNASGDTRQLENRCGRWRLAPEVGLDQETAERIARRVSIPRTLDL
jgi:hypothetical protein